MWLQSFLPMPLLSLTLEPTLVKYPFIHPSEIDDAEDHLVSTLIRTLPLDCQIETIVFTSCSSFHWLKEVRRRGRPVKVCLIRWDLCDNISLMSTKVFSPLRFGLKTVSCFSVSLILHVSTATCKPLNVTGIHRT